MNQFIGACLQKYLKTKTVYGSLFAIKLVFGSFSRNIFNTKLVSSGIVFPIESVHGRIVVVRTGGGRNYYNYLGGAATKLLYGSLSRD